jgi:hypothetical protein
MGEVIRQGAATLSSVSSKPTSDPAWGDHDDTVGRAAAEGTGEFIAAPYHSALWPLSATVPLTSAGTGQRTAPGASCRPFGLIIAGW